MCCSVNVSNELCCQFASLVCLIPSQLKYFQSKYLCIFTCLHKSTVLESIQIEVLLFTLLSNMKGSILGMQTGCGSSQREGWRKAFLW